MFSFVFVSVPVPPAVSVDGARGASTQHGTCNALPVVLAV